MSKIIDNENVLLADELGTLLPNAHQLDACVGYFNLRGWQYIQTEARKMAANKAAGRGDAEQVRLLVGMALSGEDEVRKAFAINKHADKPMSLERAIELARKSVHGFAEQLTWGIQTTKDEIGLRELLKDLKSGFMRVKFYAKGLLHAKLYIAHLSAGQHEIKVATVGSSNLTGAGLRGQGELNVEETDAALASELSDWFAGRWEDNFAVDITEELIEVIEKSWAGPDQPTPREIHLKMAYELSSDARSGLSVEVAPQFKGVLLPHQESAVQIAVRSLEERGLVVIGDVVGLGKTMTASAIAATSNTSTLFICPKNLEKMWNKYRETYDIPGKVVPMSMVHKDLKDLKHYKLVVIDEAHNLRNRNNKRWKAVREYIERGDSKVVLLTATMFNAYKSDISGQLGLKFAFDQGLGIRPEVHIADVGEQALAQATNGRLDTLQAFDQSNHNTDWQQLLSLFLVRRTRQFLEDNYGEIDEETEEKVLKFPNGQKFSFPKRVPVPLKYQGGPGDPGDNLATVENFDAIADMTYARYRIGSYLKDQAEGTTPEEVRLLEDLLKARNGASGFIRTTALKRLTSSAKAFILTLERMLLRGYVLEYALQNGLPIPIGTLSNSAYEDLEDEDPSEFEDDESIAHEDASVYMNLSTREWLARGKTAYDRLVANSPRGLRWAEHNWFDVASLENDLAEDSTTMRALIDQHGSWNPAADTKLAALATFINGLELGQKVLVFSEYKDTVDYVHQWLAPQVPNKIIEAVSGQSSDPTTSARRFAPVANAEYGPLSAGQTEIDVLLTTDVLSEGQNLHDSAIVINWDLPWTIIRVIQRAGRVDRIGQKAKEIQVMSFLPQEGLENLINLRKRLVERLKDNAEIFGGGEQFFDDDAVFDGEHIKELFNGALNLSADEGEVDYSSYALGIWNAATATEQDYVRALPNVVYSTKKFEDSVEDSVLVYCKTSSHTDVVALATTDTIKTVSPITALKMTATDPAVTASPALDDHHDLVAAAIEASLGQFGNQNLVLVNAGLRKRLYEFLMQCRENAGSVAAIEAIDDLTDKVLSQPIRDEARQRVMSIIRGAKVMGNYSDAFEMLLALDQAEILLEPASESSEDAQVVCSMGFRKI